ncbi:MULTISPECIES: glycosyltransferase [Actinoalloteichus]|uniref:Glycosyl transferase, UDP-glucuronosyltransferase n=1 Tax=Actinoalloteichus fjordicus TaxID=1612552 RepID=A0AAC9LBL1_9PSEU|nr:MULTISPECIES: glycosyltransferase [Actinoalloteichus]APU14773.1 glycosyl transferase, UDP-glucuronosyltransferase [Actinoalloteichus fjordicus]APU20744.1 glycosyl transferase, UDP-glucuronosyltransferase [Actinoalloteichus sp. GBA129-24]
MRILLVAAPGVGHLLPAVPTMWAARAAGHEILVATTGPSLDMAVRSGLPAVDVSPDGSATAGYHQLAPRALARRTAGEHATEGDPAAQWQGMTAAFGSSWSAVRDHRPAEDADFLASLFAVSGRMIDGTVRIARDWRADLLVFTSFLAAGEIAATAVGIPSVLHGMGLPHPPATGLLGVLDDVATRHGVADRLEPPAAVVDLCPEILRPPRSARGLPLRYVPYNGGALLSDVVCAVPRRPRICLTMGSVLPGAGVDEVVQSAITVAAARDAEVVLAVDTPDETIRRRLPSNVIVSGWVPLSSVLPHCSVVVHHGGSGTTFTAFAHGTPQLVLPRMADQPLNADAVRRSGSGVVLAERDLDVATLTSSLDHVLGSADIRRSCALVRAEIEAMPGPEALLVRLAELGGRQASPPAPRGQADPARSAAPGSAD